MSGITGSCSASLPDLKVDSVKPADAYFGIAEQLTIGARALASAPGCALAFTFVCGHICECVLKAFLLWKGTTEKTLKNTGHNLCKLRVMAIAKGLTIDQTEPQWLTLLNSLHHSPYVLRYPVGLNNLVTPEPQQMLSDLESLLVLTRAARN